jgi:hypothetical protein
MTFIRRHLKVATVGAACAAAGAGAGAIATASGAGTATTAQQGASTHAAARSAPRAHARRALVRRAVEGDVVVATKGGFATVTLHRGFVQAVKGRQLTIREGTKKATYKTVTLAIPAGAKVRDNGNSASLSQLTAGQRVGVLQGPKRTVVVARTPKS